MCIRDRASDISRRFGVESLAHLTCVSSTREQAARVLAELTAHGVENILALRGDIPLEGPACEDYKYAPELVRDIKAQGLSLIHISIIKSGGGAPAPRLFM